MIDYSEDWLFLLLFRFRGSLTLRSCLFAFPASGFTLFLLYLDEIKPDFREWAGMLELNQGVLWSCTTAVLGVLLGFRTNRAMSRFWEGTGLLHQMRGEWFDSVSCCVTFSRGATPTKPKEVKRMRHTLVRLMSLCHGSALEEIAGDKAQGVETIDSLGLNNATIKYLKECKDALNFNRVEVLLHLMQSVIMKGLDEGVLKVPPPILSRVFQTLSRGFVNLLNAKKIADTRFPFPFAQLITMLLLVQVLLTPLMLSSLVKSKVWAPIFTFVPIFAMFYLDFVGVELENPFGRDDNDLPLEHFQEEMNNCLLMLLHDSADLAADISNERCILDFRELKDSMTGAQRHSTSTVASLKSRARVSTFVFSEASSMTASRGIMSINDDILKEELDDGMKPAAKENEVKQEAAHQRAAQDNNVDTSPPAGDGAKISENNMGTAHSSPLAAALTVEPAVARHANVEPAPEAAFPTMRRSRGSRVNSRGNSDSQEQARHVGAVAPRLDSPLEWQAQPPSNRSNREGSGTLNHGSPGRGLQAGPRGFEPAFFSCSIEPCFEPAVSGVTQQVQVVELPRRHYQSLAER